VGDEALSVGEGDHNQPRPWVSTANTVTGTPGRSATRSRVVSNVMRYTVSTDTAPGDCGGGSGGGGGVSDTASAAAARHTTTTSRPQHAATALVCGPKAAAVRCTGLHGTATTCEALPRDTGASGVPWSWPSTGRTASPRPWWVTQQLCAPTVQHIAGGV